MLDSLVPKSLGKKTLALIVVILVAGVAVGLGRASFNQSNSPADMGAGPANLAPAFNANSGGNNVGIANGTGGETVVQMQQTTGTASATFASSSAAVPSTTPISPSNTVTQQQQQSTQTSSSSGQPANTGFIEFFSNVTVQVSSPQAALAKATAIAYDYGGYLAFSSYDNLSSLAVIRVPAANYGPALSSVEGLGNLTGLRATSNDVSIQYTDLNATLQSLLTEERSLLKLENASNSLNSTLLLEKQIQGVDSQINEIQSQILQTRLLIDYSTISATFNELVSGPVPLPLALKLTATPLSGMSPLAVTLNAIVTGGRAPYIVNYNFGDGSSYQGTTLIHTFVGGGTYNVSVTVTDASGNVQSAYVLIHVVSPARASQFEAFGSFALGLLLSVVEGIIEVAVVLLPIVAVIALVILPFRNRLRATRKTETPS